ncbi:DUF6506 family protein [Brachyspira hyodysenteriae]|uniref:Uncharacterized protein n=2 Tax=Brachyspira hyodysenteriae TaxID=159 RepID=A0A3B6VSK4_BRAHO|nr:DUF6506 family protein [Brachyspira hyodysenteriae]ANN64031.1 hypothetical protein BHYOB78_09180 [Brachyspira hyodysenteriae ATCC 27164]AUJ49582.1 hypothetical protein BH718_01137 [Brachyspira hyodysenteriae]KLI14453.1 hypothetical protein SU44_11660 [Brachyspira hyodysenteriae]KLI17757.1 hypothetical protein SU45_04230 [Brachyspira hyodysenteriae]KLI19387.1 hypothetical protein SU46_07340 [Brachyspira hyodysenteriae]
MKFAYLIMDKIFDSKKDKASIHNGVSQIIGVSNIEEACKIAKELKAEGIDCIELCGGFREEGARKIIEATENKVAVGFVVHLEEQNDIYKKLFGNEN